MNRLAFGLCVGLAPIVSVALPSAAQTTSVVHSFTGATTDGDAPTSLIQAKDGNYYGTTAFGGSQGSCTDQNGNAVGCGTVFKLSGSTVTVLYSFSGGVDGGYPTGIIQGPDGYLYGTTAFGGLVSSSTTTNPNCGTVGCGVIFKINPSQPPAAGQLVPLYTFSGASDPTVTTPAPPDGAYPNPLTQGAGGVFYGTSIPCSGCKGSSYGFLFSFTPGATTPFATLSTFGNNVKQQNHSALDYPNVLVQVNATTLYGTTLLGGDTSGCLNTASGWGCGGVFAFVLPGTNPGFENDVCYFGDNINVSTSSQSSVPASSASSGTPFRPDTIVTQSQGRFPSGAPSWTFDTAPMAIAYGADKSIYGASPALCVTYAPGANPPGSGPATLSFDPVCSASSTTITFPEAATVFQCIPPAAPIASPTTLPTGSLNTVYPFTGSGDGGGSLLGLTLASDGNYYGTSGAYAFDLTPLQMATFTSSGATLPLTSLSPFYSTLASGTTNFSPNAMIQGSDGNFYGISATGGTTATSQLPGDGAAFQVSTSLKAPVQLSFTSSTITLGASSTLNWIVPGAYSLTAEQCYAFVTSGSSATAGTWLGLQGGTLSNGIYAGSATITPTAAGSYTYALTCGGNVSGFASLLANGPALTISPTTLPAGTAETSYSQTLTAGGGSETGYKFSVTTGASSLTAVGLSLTSAGTFSGTATAGTATFTVQLVDSLNDNTTQAYTLTINKATPTVSVWPTSSAITYGKTLASSTLTGGTASVAGTFAWTTPSTAPGAGTPSESVTFTPTDATDYNTVTSAVTVTVNKATPTVSVWPTASAIVAGQTLASSALSGGNASVSGTFAWTTPSTTPSAGTPSESVTFTPTDATDYNTVAGSITVTVNAAASFTLSPSPSSVSIAQGSSGTSTITVADLGGFSGTVTLAASGLPTGVSSSFAAGSAGTQVLTLTVSASAQVTSSPVTVTVTGTSSTLSATTSISLSITAQPSFTPGSGGTTSISVNPGATTGNTGTISIVGTNGFSGIVNLSCKVTTSMTNVSDMPLCSLNPASVTLSGTTAQTSTLTVTTTAASSAENSIKKIIWPAGGTTLALVMLLVVPKKRRNWPAMIGMFLLCTAIGFVGCGGGGNNNVNNGGGNPGTTAGSYTITVTGTSGSVSATVGTVNVTVE